MRQRSSRPTARFRGKTLSSRSIIWVYKLNDRGPYLYQRAPTATPGSVSSPLIKWVAPAGCDFEVEDFSRILVAPGRWAAKSRHHRSEFGTLLLILSESQYLARGILGFVILSLPNHRQSWNRTGTEATKLRCLCSLLFKTYFVFTIRFATRNNNSIERNPIWNKNRTISTRHV